MSKRSILVLVASLALMFSAANAFADNSLDVNANAAIVGNFGLEVLVDGSLNAVYVADTSPADETVYRVEFRVGHNNITMDNGSFHHLFMGRQGGGVGNVVRITMQRLNDEYKLIARVTRDGAGTYFAGKFTFAPVNTRVGFDWVASSGANDGVFRLRKGDNVQFERTDLDNDTFEIDTARFGLPKATGSIATTSGSYYLDDFSSFRTLAP